MRPKILYELVAADNEKLLQIERYIDTLLSIVSMHPEVLAVKGFRGRTHTRVNLAEYPNIALDLIYLEKSDGLPFGTKKKDYLTFCYESVGVEGQPFSNTVTLRGNGNYTRIIGCVDPRAIGVELSDDSPFLDLTGRYERGVRLTSMDPTTRTQALDFISTMLTQAIDVFPKGE